MPISLPFGGFGRFTGVGSAIGRTGGEILYWMERVVGQFMDLVGLR